MEIAILRAGMQTTVQDLGRRGFRSQGVPLGGAMDRFALRVANLLVGNAEDAAALEITFTGPEIEFAQEGWVSFCGACFEGVPTWRPVHVHAGERVRFGRRLEGCRSYMAVSGGLDVPRVMGGAGTYLAAAVGGFGGRALRDGDVLRSLPARRAPTEHWGIDQRMLPKYSREALVRSLPGANAAEFGDRLYQGRFAVTPRSDRMGIRLQGAKVERSGGAEQLSAAVAPGTVQVPADGNPIVLMADAQTLGGYPRVAHIAAVDMPIAAQLAPGDHVRFASIALAEAHALALSMNRQLGLLRQGLAEKMRRL